MFTSSRSSPARANSRRNRGSRRCGVAGRGSASPSSVRSRVRVQRLDLVVRRRREPRRAPDVAAQRRACAARTPPTCTAAARLSDAIVGIRGNRRDDRCTARARRWTVPTSRCRTRARRRRPPPCAIASARRLAHRQHAPGEFARPRRQPDRQRAPASASSSVATTRRAVEHGRCAGGERVGLRRRESAPARRARAARAPSSASRAPPRRCCRDGCAHEHDADATRVEPAVAHGGLPDGSITGNVGRGGYRMTRRARGRNASALARTVEYREAHASDAHDGREGRTPRRQHHQSRRARSRSAHGHGEGPQGFRQRSRPRGGSGDRRDAACRRIPTTRSSPRKARPRAQSPTPSTCGSSTRSTARPTSCTAFRSTACRSRSRTRRS